MSCDSVNGEVNFLVLIWADQGKISYELEYIHFNCQHELILDKPLTSRSLLDWLEDSFGSDLNFNIKNYLPEELEICEEPIFCEVIGKVEIIGETDYFGEYDEEIRFEIIKWSVEIDDEFFVPIEKKPKSIF